MFTRAQQLSLASARCIQSTPSHPISLRSLLTIFYLDKVIDSDKYMYTPF